MSWNEHSEYPEKNKWLYFFYYKILLQDNAFWREGFILSLYFIGGPEKGRGKYPQKGRKGPEKGQKGFEENENVWH